MTAELWRACYFFSFFSSHTSFSATLLFLLFKQMTADLSDAFLFKRKSICSREYCRASHTSPKGSGNPSHRAETGWLGAVAVAVAAAVGTSILLSNGFWGMHLTDKWCLRSKINQIRFGLIWINPKDKNKKRRKQRIKKKRLEDY